MLVMTAKLDKKKLAIVIAAVLVLVVGLILLLRKPQDSPTAVTDYGSNDARVAFLRSFGWEVTTSPTESGQVKIPEKPSEVFQRYNSLQKSQGYDLSAFAGKTVMRYVYKITNYPGATEPVYATVLIYKNQVIGGDVTDTAKDGVVQGFKMPKQEAALPSTAPTVATTAPTAPTSPTGAT